MTKISIITISFNAESTIIKSVQSVLSQKIPCEYIIVDGCSLDKTTTIVNNFSSYIAKSISEKDDGIYDAMNKGIELASGDIIGFLNSDDYYVGGGVLSRVEQVLSGSQYASCYGDLMYIDQKNRPVRYWKSGSYSRSKLYWGWMPPHPTFFVKKNIFDRYGLFNNDFGTAADYELMLRFLLKYQISCAYIPHVLVCMRTGGVSNSTFGGRVLANQYDRAAWKHNGLKPYPWTLLFKPLRKIKQYFFSKTAIDNARIQG